MGENFRDMRLMLVSFNPGLTRAEISKIVQPFGPILDIILHRKVVNNTMYNLSIAFIHFSTKDGFLKALNTDLSNQNITFGEIDPFYLCPHVVFIFGLTRPGDISTYKNMFEPLGANELKIIEKAYSWKDYVIAANFKTKTSFTSFIKIVNKSYVSGNLVHVIPFHISDNSCTYQASMPNLSVSINDKNSFDFTLLYYDREYKCWSGSAISLCKTISNAYNDFLNKNKGSHQDDESDTEEPIEFNEFIVPQIPGPFELIVQYINGQTIQFNDINAPFIMLMSEQLGIKRLYSDACRFVYECQNLESNAVMLEQLYELNGNISPLLAIVANKFEEVCDSLTVGRYPKELLEIIISSKFFSIRNEDKLLNYINKFKHIDSIKYQFLLKQVRIECLSNEALIGLVSDRTIDLNMIREGLLRLSNQINFSTVLNPLKSKSSNQSEEVTTPTKELHAQLPKNLKNNYNQTSFGDIYRVEDYSMHDNELFNGIFEALRRSCNGQNPCTLRIIFIRASTICHENPSVLLDHDSQTWFGTSDQPNSYILFDFNLLKVALNGYSLKTHSHEGNGHITGWVLEGSNDDHEYVPIHRIPMTDVFGTHGAEKYYSLPKAAPFYRYIKLTQTRQNTMGYHNLRLSEVEFFGSIKPAT